MNNRGTLLGQIIESPGASIIVFVIMLIFVIVSGFISGSHFEIYDLMSDFVSDYVIFEDKVVTVEGMRDKKIALEIINKSIKTYTSKFKK